MSSILQDVVERAPSLTKDLVVDGQYVFSVESLISTAFLTLKQNGLLLEQPEWVGDWSKDVKLEWEDVDDENLLETAKQYVVQYVMLMFDPPPTQQQTILEKSLEHLLWRIRMEVENGDT